MLTDSMGTNYSQRSSIKFSSETIRTTRGMVIPLYLCRLNINNKDYMLLKEKKDRAVKYWKERVIGDFLPPIDVRKRNEINDRVEKLKSYDSKVDRKLQS